MESDNLETEDLVDHTAVYRYTSFLDHTWLRICMSIASTDFPSYASQVACQASHASQDVSHGSNMRKCIKNIYNGEKACLSPFSSQKLTKKKSGTPVAKSCNSPFLTQSSHLRFLSAKTKTKTKKGSGFSLNIFLLESLGLL